MKRPGMICPICKLPMELLIEAAGDLGWCARCGTLVSGRQVDRPRLVGLVRQFVRQKFPDSDAWDRAISELRACVTPPLTQIGGVNR